MLLGSQYEQSVPREVRTAIEDMNHLDNVLGWAKTRLSERGNASAARACEDLHDSAQMTKQFMLRESPFASAAVRELQQTIQGTTQELQQSPGEPEIQEVAERHDATPAQVSLAWVLSHDNVAAIPKASSREHMEQNLAAQDLELDDEDVALIDSIDRRHRNIDSSWGPWNW